jgi:hypothetical protein
VTDKQEHPNPIKDENGRWVLNSTKNGFARDIERYKLEYNYYWKDAMKRTLKQFFTLHGGVSDLFHNYVDIFVESRRASPWLSGHLGAFAFPVGVLSFVYVVVDLIK